MSATATTADPALPRTHSDAVTSDDIIDTTPFLLSDDSRSENGNNDAGNRRYVRRQGLREAARFLRRAGSRRMMREQSMLVREAASDQLEERQSDWAYSKPVVVLDIVWNLAFLAVAVAVMVLSREERPNVPLRLWIVGYAMQCLLHMVCVSLEYKRRRRRRRGTRLRLSSSSSSSLEEGDLGVRNSEQQYVSLAELEEDNSRYL